jgi:hypothetical protein
VQPPGKIDPEAVLFADSAERIAEVDVLMVTMQIVCLPCYVAAFVITLQNAFRHFRSPPIVRLFLCRCPTAVGRFIVAVHIYAVKCALHICGRIVIACLHSPIEEGLKIVLPFIAHFDSPAAVVRITLQLFVVAAVLHIAPNAI